MVKATELKNDRRAIRAELIELEIIVGGAIFRRTQKLVEYRRELESMKDSMSDYDYNAQARSIRIQREMTSNVIDTLTIAEQLLSQHSKKELVQMVLTDDAYRQLIRSALSLAQLS